MTVEHPDDEEEDELETAMGHICTHVDCPHCDHDEYLEGDWEGDIFDCPACRMKSIVRRT